ncbi:mavicyanin [Ziziphus jujuba]|uniref:Mavicyanin n=1 Tax=Ziziphus jujuba TaxID=326968 RepID=A0A6P3ZET2_ZIZJJ|nr:mavicyanin [Ziziphus jujuba]
MEKMLNLVYAFVLLGFVTTCTATTYLVGDTSGWDISTNLATWAQDKTFNVGDVLLFQYSSSHSVSEVKKEAFDKCETTNVLKTYSGGNSTITLTKPGERYFVCGNKLHCLGGMKLQVNVENNQDYAPAGQPESSSGSDEQGQGASNINPKPSSRTNFPTSNSAFKSVKSEVFVFASLGLMASMLLSLKI